MPPATTAPRRQLPPLAVLLRPLPDLLADGGPAAVLLVAMVAERFGAGSRLDGRLPLALTLTVLVAVAAATRRHAPLASYLVATAVLTVEAQTVLPSPVSPYANLLGAYALGRHGGRWAGFGPPLVVVGVAGYFTGQDVAVLVPIGVLAVWLAVWAFGWAGAHRVAEQAAERRRAREELLAEERGRIAREVHDLVGHSLSLMLVQAGAARRLLDRTPDRSSDLLLELEHTGTDALDELDRVLGLLRGTAPQHPDAARQPEPGLAELPRLVGRMDRAGLRVTLHRDTPPLPADLDRCAYRVVQEALTNTLRHSGAGRAEVRLGTDGAALTVQVQDDGSGPPSGHRPGRGLTGVAERAARLHGTAEHGPGPAGGFLLRVTLPLS
ncbi:sensor histidine kinase [Streptomyces sp. TLI_171]|uniref:sensor histidine kinase n=1 Tax=Streptomyces sp. TLI_171 TaxID=1938859 RepID=UPI000C199029|nr:histidine kinase [Streptomyces sp. TLI_171]RKE22420.1 signal transduction histidine kinase [Streptomyces sp. TLI_171]